MALVDCNGNGISDSVDIANPLAGDLNGDTHVNAEDLGTLLARWGLVPESVELQSFTNEFASSTSLSRSFYNDIACRSQTHCTGKQYANEKAKSGDKDLLKFVWTLNLFHINKKVVLRTKNCKSNHNFFKFSNTSRFTFFGRMAI